MSVRKKAFLAIVLCGINFLGFLMLAVNVNQVFIIPAVLISAILAVYLMLLRCPHCGNLIIKKRTKIMGAEFSYWGGAIPRRCSNCGQDLEQKDGTLAKPTRP